MEINGVAVVNANEGIKITIAVEISKYRAGNGGYIRDPEGIAAGCSKGWCGRAGVLEINGVAVVVANEGIKITVAVEIGKLRAGNGAYIRDPEGLLLAAAKAGAADEPVFWK